METIREYRHTSKHFLAAYTLAILGMAMIVAAMAMPPMGHIDPTVLAAFGEILTFAGALAGMDYKNGKNNTRQRNEENNTRQRNEENNTRQRNEEKTTHANATRKKQPTRKSENNNTPRNTTKTNVKAKGKKPKNNTLCSINTKIV